MGFGRGMRSTECNLCVKCIDSVYLIYSIYLIVSYVARKTILKFWIPKGNPALIY